MSINIQIEETEINKAIKGHIKNLGLNLDNCNVSITYTQRRDGRGTIADIAITNDAPEVPSVPDKPVKRVAEATEATPAVPETSEDKPSTTSLFGSNN